MSTDEWVRTSMIKPETWPKEERQYWLATREGDSNAVIFATWDEFGRAFRHTADSRYSIPWRVVVAYKPAEVPAYPEVVV